ncbi:DnaB-like helicase N-terminal domain-containing protein [Streptomyces sp. NPDC001250]|uniref:DnaB-like helicase N-terminal domain-containing protein n=1 Tax=unclassified Streptomyces TaxID=2593676 RepID=UPI00331EE2C0
METDGVPPHSLDAEKAVLRAMLSSSDAVADIVEVLHEADFYRPAHGLIYTTVLDLYARGQAHDQVAVAAELAKQEQLEQAGGSDYLNAVASGLARRSATWLKQAKRVQALAVPRRTKEAAAASRRPPDNGTLCPHWPTRMCWALLRCSRQSWRRRD